MFKWKVETGKHVQF